MSMRYFLASGFVASSSNWKVSSFDREESKIKGPCQLTRPFLGSLKPHFVPLFLNGSAQSSDPALYRLAYIGRQLIEADLRLPRVFMYDVDELFKQQEVARDGSYTSTDHDAVPLLPLEVVPYDRLGCLGCQLPSDVWTSTGGSAPGSAVASPLT